MLDLATERSFGNCDSVLSSPLHRLAGRRKRRSGLARREEGAFRGAVSAAIKRMIMNTASELDYRRAFSYRLITRSRFSLDSF